MAKVNQDTYRQRVQKDAHNSTAGIQLVVLQLYRASKDLTSCISFMNNVCCNQLSANKKQKDLIKCLKQGAKS